MTKTQALIASEVLNMASDVFSNHGCSNFYIPNTPNNLEFTQQLLDWNGDPDDNEVQLSPDGTIIYLQDWLVMSFCADMLEEYALGGDSR